MTEHVTEVTASSLYEAVALGLRAIRDSEWAGQLPECLNEVTVSSAVVRVQHAVRMDHFKKWMGQQGRTPAEILHRKRIRELLDR